MEIIHYSGDNFDEVIKEKDVLVDFYATWCGPCRMLAPELERVSEKVLVVKVDIDENMDLAKRFGIMSVPTLIYFKNDGSYEKRSGYMPSDDILAWIGE